MTRTTRTLALLGLVAALALFLAAVASAHPAATAGKKAPSAAKVVHVKLIVRSDEQHGKKGSDGKWHDAFLPASFAVRKGVTVKVTVLNYDDMPHSFNAPGLHLNKIILAGGEKKASKTTFTFKAMKAGKFAWHCDPACDPWAMKHVGFMKGFVTVRA